jgi:hypothetical protein
VLIYLRYRYTLVLAMAVDGFVLVVSYKAAKRVQYS